MTRKAKNARYDLRLRMMGYSKGAWRIEPTGLPGNQIGYRNEDLCIS